MTDQIQPGQWVRWMPDAFSINDPDGRWRHLTDIALDPDDWPSRVLLVFADGENYPSHTKYLQMFSKTGKRQWDVSDVKPEEA